MVEWYGVLLQGSGGVLGVWTAGRWGRNEKGDLEGWKGSLSQICQCRHQAGWQRGLQVGKWEWFLTRGDLGPWCTPRGRGGTRGITRGRERR